MAQEDFIRLARETPTISTDPVIIPRAEHGISRSNISESALKVLYRLRQAGYAAYLVGGGVRDLLLGREPKDFDVATDARPEEVKELFRNCRLIGRRFVLAHVRFGREIIEVATFRAQHVGAEGEGEVEGEGVMEDGMILRDNVFGSLEDDAWRRDFTVNALYYNIADFSVVDYTGGMDDLRAGVLRVIGEPGARLREDPVRMLRAVRFAAKLGFRLHPDIEAGIDELGELLTAVPPARLFDEVLKMFQGGYAVQGYELLRHYRLFGYLFPQTEACLAEEEGHFPHTLLVKALASTDTRIAAGKPVTPAFLFAALLWDPVRHAAARLQEEGMSELQALQAAGQDVVAEQTRRVTFPKRFSLQSREIWTLQARLPARAGKRALRLLENPRFRAAYDFLVLRAEAGEDVGELAEWWTRFQEADHETRQAMSNAVKGGANGGANGGGGGKRRRRRRKRPSASS